jgi:hypothetical protein
MSLIRKQQGTRVNSGHKTEGARPRPKMLSCGHTQNYQVPPKNGDLVFCQTCDDYVSAGKKT